MIVVMGHVDVDPGSRERFVELSQEAVRQARAADGCLHFAVTADPLDPGRVDIAERWRDRVTLEAFRGAGPEDESAEAIRAFHVEEIAVPGNVDQDGTEAEIRALLEERVRAVAAKDSATLAARFDDDLDSFGVLPPYRVLGREPQVEGMQAWLDGYESDIGYDVWDLRVVADADLAVAAFVYRVTGVLRGGTDVDMSVRATAAFQRGADGRWVLTHQHESVPWDPETGKGVLAPGDGT